VRFKTERSGSVTYVDKVFGEIVTPNLELQDFVLLRSDGVPLYNFGAVVDDIMMGVTLVARGRDHMINTPPQILLYQAFGATVPEFAHLPMMLAATGEKLSKRHGAVSVTEYRDNGYSPDAVLDYLARFGWSSGEHEVRLSRDELVAAFDWAQCGRGDGKFDPKKFLAINHDHLKSPHLTPDAVYARRTMPFLHARGLAEVTFEQVKRALPSIRERAQTFVQAADLLDPFFREPPTMDEKAARKFLVGSAAPRLRALHRVLHESPGWDAPSLEARITTWLSEAQLELKDIGQPVRVALTGRSASPSLFEVLELLGRTVALARLSRAADMADANPG
jgi:glutamyl-tRNA synthetase